ncbi:hypothetical protein PVAG01_02377 [Phlyctema vagabunda]|uniref:Mediator complex subunit 11 n=1 Tax=Phlyctema vagabunda TaxID=108571 RepID=A0ABR4PRR4_9HELO
MAVGQPASAQVSAKGVTSNAPTADNGAQPSTAPDQGDDVWDEERLEESLKTLKEMYIQLRGLRSTVPRLVAPLTTKKASPENQYKAFAESAATATQEVQQFRRLISDEKSTKILEHARQSRADNPSGIKPWRITDHPDWNIRDA